MNDLKSILRRHLTTLSKDDVAVEDCVNYLAAELEALRFRLVTQELGQQTTLLTTPLT